MSHPTQNRSFQSRSSQPISWLSTEGLEMERSYSWSSRQISQKCRLSVRPRQCMQYV